MRWMKQKGGGEGVDLGLDILLAGGSMRKEIKDLPIANKDGVI